MSVDTVFKLLFGGTMATGVGFSGWREISDYFVSRIPTHEFDRIYMEMGDYFEREIQHIPNKVVKDRMEDLKEGCHERINIFVPKSITGTEDMVGKLKDDSTQRKITRHTFGISGAESWAHILRNNIYDYNGLINYSKILKRACEVYEGDITLELGHIPQTYRLFRFMGIKTQWGFEIKNDKFKNILYGAIEGDYQTTNTNETNIDRVLESIS